MVRAIQKPTETPNTGIPPEGKKCQGPQDLSRLELECMRAIWLQTATTVLQVQRCLESKRPLAYTTILTVLDRLAQKGAVNRVKRGKAHHYRATLSFAESREMALRELVDFYFEGSSQKLMDHFTSATPPSRAPNEISPHARVRPSTEMNECLL